MGHSCTLASTIRCFGQTQLDYLLVWLMRSFHDHPTLQGWEGGRGGGKFGIHSAQTAWCATTFDQDWSLVPEYWAGADVESLPYGAALSPGQTVLAQLEPRYKNQNLHRRVAKRSSSQENHSIFWLRSRSHLTITKQLGSSWRLPNGGKPSSSWAKI